MGSVILDPGEAINVVSMSVGRGIVEALLEDVVEVALEDLHGRLIADPVKAPMPLPHTLKSTLDGYAVSLEDVEGASEGSPVRLGVSGHVRIGDWEVPALRGGECYRVDTGSRVPVGTEAVIPKEEVSEQGRYILVFGEQPMGRGLALPATDIDEGDIVLPRGYRVTPEVVASLASMGYGKIRASRRARVTVLSVGDELVDPGEELEPGGVYESNRHYLRARLQSMGYEVLDGGIIGDSPGEVEEALTKASRDSDLVIVSGGTSVGEKDYVRKFLEAKAEVLVGGLKLRPGRPTIVARLGGKLLIGVPGNPRSSVNVMESFIVPLLDRLGLPAGSRPPRKASVLLSAPVRRDPRRTLILPLATIEASGRRLAFPLAVESYMIASLPLADSTAALGPGRGEAFGLDLEAFISREPEETIVALTDTRLINLEWPGARIIHVDPAASPVCELLEGTGAWLLASSRQCSPSRFRLHEEAERSIIMVAAANECSRVAVYKAYRELAPKGRVFESPRAGTALALYTQGYADCAVIPEDYLATGSRIDVLGREKVFLARA